MTVRNPFDAPDVTSRRGGRVKPPLSRDAIVTEALEELTRDGLAGLSLRKVAAALDTGPASLYAYVDNLQELQALVLDRALASVDLRSSRRAGWRDRLVKVLASYLEVLCRSSGLAQLAFGTVAVGPNALRIIEALLGLLEEAGIDRASAAFAVDLLILYVTAIAAEHSDGGDPGNPEGSAARAIRGVAEHAYPRIHAAREDLLAGTGGERFAWAINVLLTGILETSRMRSKAPGSRTRAKASRRKRRSK